MNYINLFCFFAICFVGACSFVALTTHRGNGHDEEKSPKNHYKGHHKSEQRTPRKD